MARTAATWYHVNPAIFTPKENVMEGGATQTGLRDIVANYNYASRYMTPTVVQQFFRGPTFKHYNVGDSAYVNLGLWLFPAISGHAATTQLQVRVWAKTDTSGTTGTLQLTTGAGAVQSGSVTFAADYEKYSITVPYTTAAAGDFLQLEAKWDGTSTSGDLLIKSITAWVDNGDASDADDYMDILTAKADEPMSSYLPSYISGKITDLIKSRPAQLFAWCDDLRLTTRTHISTDPGYYAINGVPLRLSPNCTGIHVEVLAYGPATTTLEVETDYSRGLSTPTSETVSLATSLTSPVAPADFVSGSIEVMLNSQASTDSLYMTLVNAAGAGTAYLVGVCAWEIFT